MTLRQIIEENPDCLDLDVAVALPDGSLDFAILAWVFDENALGEPTLVISPN